MTTTVTPESPTRMHGRGRGGDCERMSTRTLTYRYVSERLNSGEINQRTAAQLRYRLRSFCEFAPADPKRVNRRHVERWMAVPNLSPAFRRARFSALRGFCQWAAVRKHLTNDPTLGMKVPKVPPGLPRALRHDDAAEVIRHCHDNRTRLAALLMLQEGLRRAEVAGILVSDVCLRANQVAVRGKGGAGNVTRVVPLSEETVRVLRSYMGEIGMRTGHLLRSQVHPDRGLTPAHVGTIVTNAMKEAGVKVSAGDGVSPHALRHTCAHELVDNGATVLEVQEALGHASVSNTMIYLRGHVSADLRTAMAGRRYL